MIASNFKIGTRFKNKETGHVISVIEEGNKYFEDEVWGDLFDFVDEDLYDELY
ncbi:TPA: hypothetical protein I9089_002298 [Clostridium perfringens]|nr:hypothetical protein [Clostridium perfringens]